MALHGGHKGMADFMVGDDPLFLLGYSRVLPLVTGNYRLHALLQIRLADHPASHPHRPQRRLIDNIGKLRAAGAVGRSRNGVKVHRIIHLDILGVNLKDRFPAFQIRKLHRDPPVKTARS